eukprot:scaffold480597_cov22-Prasinocladus_malaysianus.AAC.1
MHHFVSICLNHHIPNIPQHINVHASQVDYRSEYCSCTHHSGKIRAEGLSSVPYYNVAIVM